MSTSQPENITVDILKKAVERQLKSEMEIEFAKQIKELDRRKDEIISGILLNVMKTVDIQSYADHIVFTVRTLDANHK